MPKKKYGFLESDWNAAKEEARQIMIERARSKSLITYSELVEFIKSIELGAHDQRLFAMLEEISVEEFNKSRCMLTAVVVHKYGFQQPGDGFYELAKSLGKDIKDREAFWIKELKIIYDYWSK